MVWEVGSGLVWEAGPGLMWEVGREWWMWEAGSGLLLLGDISSTTDWRAAKWSDSWERAARTGLQGYL